MPNTQPLRKKDLAKDGLQVDLNKLHRLWTEFLLLSPSYELARKFRASKGKLSKQDQARLPKDFDHVLKVYDDFGDVQEITFPDWWRLRGVNLFGSANQKSSLKALAKIAKTTSFEASTITGILMKYLDNSWALQNKPGVLFIALPLDLTQQSAIKSIKLLLEKHRQPAEPPAKPKYELAQKDIHLQNVVDAMKVLWLRSAKPNLSLYELGEVCGIKKGRRPRTPEPEVYGGYRTLESMTSRKYKIARYLAENAARGIFPSQAKPKYSVDFDPVEFNKILAARTKWVKEQKLKEPASK
jgi:hypothetical protein